MLRFAFTNVRFVFFECMFCLVFVYNCVVNVMYVCMLCMRVYIYRDQ